MNTIIEKNSFVLNILGEPIIDKNTKYRLSKYSMILNYKNTALIYNTMTKELAELDTEEAKLLLSDNRFVANDILFPLIKNWFLVAENVNEKLLNDQLVVIAKLRVKCDAITNFVIFPTTDCNARCFYCFEKGYKRLNMSEHTAVDVANYIIKVSKGKRIKLNWFGGEPLFNSDAIDTICSSLMSKNIDYFSHMVSNGYLFDDETIQKSKQIWKLKSVQITLDGSETIYNKTKAYIYKNVESPFKTVYRNIGKLLLNDIRVKIRLNMDMHNIEDLYELIDMLYNDYRHFENLTIYPAILFEEIGGDKKRRNDIERELVYSAYLDLCLYLLDKGLLNILPLSRVIRTHRCMADNDASVEILPNGNLGKCEHYTDCEIFGSIYNDEKDNDLIDSWKVLRKEIEFCSECIHYPNCIKLEKCKNGTPSECIDLERQKELFFLKASIQRSYDLWCAGKLDPYTAEKIKDE